MSWTVSQWIQQTEARRGFIIKLELDSFHSSRTRQDFLLSLLSSIMCSVTDFFLLFQYQPGHMRFIFKNQVHSLVYNTITCFCLIKSIYKHNWQVGVTYSSLGPHWPSATEITLSYLSFCFQYRAWNSPKGLRNPLILKLWLYNRTVTSFDCHINSQNKDVSWIKNIILFSPSVWIIIKKMSF